MAWLHRDAPEAAPAPPPGVVRAAGVWLLAGTEPPAPGPAPAARARPPRLLAPAPGTVVALDPDVPPGRQRMAFEAAAAGAGFRYALDGADLGPAAGPLLWAPQPGLHRLALVDAEARVVDAVEFEVRGRGPAAGAP
jgi:penicillin-binding protein 1C